MFYLVRFNKCSYDQYDGFVIASNSEKEAIKRLEEYTDKGNIWETADWENGYTIEEMKEEDYKNNGIVLSSYNAG